MKSKAFLLKLNQTSLEIKHLEKPRLACISWYTSLNGPIEEWLISLFQLYLGHL